MTGIRPLALAAALCGLAAATLASAAPTASETVAARHANFKKIGQATKAIKEELAGRADKARIAGAASTIAATARAQAKLFPAGTGPSAGVKTDALPAVWTQRPVFDAALAKLVAEADKLAAVSRGGDKAAMGAQFKALGGACKACHDQFRRDD